MEKTTHNELPPLPLPEGVTSQYVECITTGLNVHFLSAGSPNEPLILLLHGYPDLAFSWRHVLAPLASLTDCYVVAPDQRGYGRTTGWENRAKIYEDVHLEDFSSSNAARDLVVFVRALGYAHIECVVGHDFGAVSGSMLALMRPDMVGKLILMSHPFKMPPALLEDDSVEPMPDADHANSERTKQSKKKQDKEFQALGARNMDQALGKLGLKHYRSYNSSPPAGLEWNKPKQGLKEFLLGYFHVKSGLFEPNKHAGSLAARSAEEMARMPYYYIMPQHVSMPGAVTQLLLDTKEKASASYEWIDEQELEVYVSEWSRTDFLGGLSWYRARNDPQVVAQDWALFSGMEKLSMPVKFISGAQDWGNWQEYGALEAMESGKSCEKFRGKVMIQGAGHWVQQEKPDEVVTAIDQFVSVDESSDEE